MGKNLSFPQKKSAPVGPDSVRPGDWCPILTPLNPVQVQNHLPRLKLKRRNLLPLQLVKIGSKPSRQTKPNHRTRDILTPAIRHHRSHPNRLPLRDRLRQQRSLQIQRSIQTIRRRSSLKLRPKGERHAVPGGAAQGEGVVASVEVAGEVGEGDCRLLRASELRGLGFKTDLSPASAEVDRRSMAKWALDEG
jgi:hypothetical protein